MRNTVILIPIYREKYLRQTLVLKTLLEILRPAYTGIQNDNGNV